MERTIFLQHYRICLASDGAPNELGRDGAAIAYEATDERSGEAVAVTLVPVESIDPEDRGQFEEQARVVERLRHVNIAKVFDFGREGENYIYVSERPQGETTVAWVSQHGPMPADAVLRVAEQIVSVLSSASFHKLPYPAIDPSGIIIVPGQTPEGGWPLVKLNNFGLTGLKSDAEMSPLDNMSYSNEKPERESKRPGLNEQEPAAVRSITAESRNLTREHGTGDVRAQVYSLGATMYFLLTGVELSAGIHGRRVKFSGFPKPLRNLLSRMLHPNPDQRPRDLVVLGEMIRSCLLKIERRLALADRYGIPLRTKVSQPAPPRSGRVLRTALAVGAVIVAAAVVGAVLFPESLASILHQSRNAKNIGVLVGVAEPSATPASVPNDSAPVAPATVLSQAANAAAALSNQPPTDGGAIANSSQTPPSGLEQDQIPNGQPQVPPTPDSLAATSPDVVPENSAGSEASSSTKGPEVAQPATNSQSSTGGKKKRVASTSAARQGSVRVRMVGITPDGRLIYRLPSGRTRIVAPDSDGNQPMPRRHRRAFIQRDQMFAPPPQFGPDYPPYD